MSIFTRDDTAAKLTAEVDRLEKRKAALTAKLDAARKAETDAREAQRNHLLSDDESPDTATRLAAAVTTAVADVAAITDALQTVDMLIEEGKAAVVAAREAGERQKRPAEIAAKITKLEPMIATAESLFDKLADVLTRIIDTADDRDLILREYSAIKGPGAPLPAINLVSAALTEALFKSLPDGFAVSKIPTATYAAAVLPLMIRRDGGLSPDLPLDDETGQGFRPLPLSGALSANLVDPLRAAAAEIVAGERPITTARTAIDDDDGEDTEPTFDWKWLVFIKPTTWRDWKGETVTQADSRAMVPDPVARAALAAGVAVPENSPEAQTHENWRHEKGFHHSAVAMGKQTVTLDVKWPATTRAAA